MKLEQLTITNFMRVPEADIDLSGSALHCFCGPNEAGKSTISEAIRFALLGDTPRVDKKKDFGQLLHSGEKKGSVQIVADGGSIQISRDVGTGKAGVEALANVAPSAVAALRLALGAQGFVDMTPDDRRKMLFDVCQVSMGPDEVGARLIAKGLPEAFVTKQIKPLLKASVDAALATAVDKQKTLRAQWQATTGEAFGEQKGETWTAPAPAKPKSGAASIDIAAAQRALTDLDNLTTAAATKVGKVKGGVERRRGCDERLDRLKGFVDNQSQILKEREGLLKQQSTINDQIATHEEMIQRADAAAVQTLSCPGCSTHLKLTQTAEGPELEFSGPPVDFHDDVGPAKRRAALADLRKELADVQSALNTCNARLDAVAKQRELSDGLIAERDQLPTEKDLVDAEESLRASRQKLLVDRELLDEAVKYRRAVEQAEQATKQAKDLFEAWKFWGQAVDLLKPSGIPGEILAEAMEKVNRRLAASAGLAGWGAPYIGDDMSITRQHEAEDGADPVELPYQLLSESARWRVSAVIAEVISEMSGMKLLILDRWDVLDMKGRGQFMKWARVLAEDSFETIITMATLKGSPSEVPKMDGFQVHWVQDGVVS